ncbi:uncharacterized protein BYT42DRAFT_487659 [Radiomyces spectabilis]|uniref:uncharacterized protein n=1 Tax=Radiomyces spectabilis TaxID=64574 RepID=UPI00221FC5E9|nr:uncharacterized protein BYT42DRAFT_487659 [Radiomyces spectabilis]KAI8393864.1 hypothetical protein BYT42DRAFT_487659 [Radiomyces spectabilis]
MPNEDSDAFNVNNVFTDVPLNNDDTEKPAKKKSKKLSEEEKEKQRNINREAREKKKKLKEKNKKRKRGEQVSDDSDAEDQGSQEKEGDEKTANGDAEKPAKKKSKSDGGAKKPKKDEHGVWVGNLAFSTSSDDIKKFFSDCGDITRIKCPKGDGPKKQNKGFAYVFFENEDSVAKAVEKSEQTLDKRALLIKDANNFERKDGLPAANSKEGSKAKKEIQKQKNPPCPTLFVGNLSFDTKREALQELFAWAGDIRKVRMATFEDSGKCKGFAYIDFHTVESATKAIRAPDKHTLDGRKLRVEFGSAEAHMRSKPWLMRRKATGQDTSERQQAPSDDTSAEATEDPQQSQRQEQNESFKQQRLQRKEAKAASRPPKSNERVKPGQALFSAQRQKPTVQEFKGTKIVFGDD